MLNFNKSSILEFFNLNELFSILKIYIFGRGQNENICVGGHLKDLGKIPDPSDVKRATSDSTF